MDATARDHGVNHQAGRDQTIINNTYYGPPPPDRPPGVPGKSSRQRTVWTVAAAAGGVALLAVVISQLGGGVDGDNGGTTTGPTGGPTTASPSPSSSPSASQSGNPSPPGPDPKPAAGGVRWKGTLRLDNSDVDHEKDLDGKRPTAVDKNDEAGDLRLRLSGGSELAADNGAIISEWTDGGLPSAADCADTVEAAGLDEQLVTRGKVYCLKTSGGHYARLKVTQSSYDVSDTAATFDIVIWNDA